MSTHEVIFLKEHILRLQEELGKHVQIEMLPNKEYLFDRKILDPLIALYDHKLKEQTNIIRMYEREAHELKESLKNIRRSDSGNDLSQLQVLQLSRQVEGLEQENEELAGHLDNAESTLEAASEKLDVYHHGIEEITKKYKSCVKEFQTYSESTKAILIKTESKYNKIIKIKTDKIGELETIILKTEKLIHGTKTSVVSMARKADEYEIKQKDLLLTINALKVSKVKLEEENLCLQNKIVDWDSRYKLLQDNSMKSTEKKSLGLVKHIKIYEEKILKLDHTLQETQLKLSNMVKNKQEEIIALKAQLQKTGTENKDLQHHIQKLMEEPTQSENYEMMIHNVNHRLRESELNRTRAEQDYLDIKKCFQESEDKFTNDKRVFLEQISLLEIQYSSAVFERDRKSDLLKTTTLDLDAIQIKYNKLKLQLQEDHSVFEEELKIAIRTTETIKAESGITIKDLKSKFEDLSLINVNIESEYSKLQSKFATKIKDNSDKYEIVVHRLKEALQDMSKNYEASSVRIKNVSVDKIQYEKELSDCQKLYRQAQESIIELRSIARQQQDTIKQNLKKLNSVMEERRLAYSKVDQLTLKLSQQE